MGSACNNTSGNTHVFLMVLMAYCWSSLDYQHHLLRYAVQQQVLIPHPDVSEAENKSDSYVGNINDDFEADEATFPDDRKYESHKSKVVHIGKKSPKTQWRLLRKTLTPPSIEVDSPINYFR